MEEDVVETIAGGNLRFDFFLEIVVGVFCFPDAMLDREVVNQSTVSAKGLLAGALELVLLHEVPSVGRAATLE